MSFKRFFIQQRLFSSAASVNTKQVAHPMAERMRILEKKWDTSIPAGQPYIIRLDGVAFRHFTSSMKKPFDPRLTQAMVLTGRDLMEKCVARTVYCQSDEITMVFASEPSPLQIMYAGRVQKIISVIASWCSVLFNKHINSFDWEESSTENGEKIKARLGEGAVFDARIFTAPDEIMASEAVYWRHALDGRRNIVSMVAHSLLPHKKVMGKSLNELLDVLKTEHSVNPFSDYPSAAVYGVFLKKKVVPHMGFNPVTQQMVPTVRNRIEGRSFDWTSTSELERAELIMARHWDDSHPATLQIIDLND